MNRDREEAHDGGVMRQGRRFMNLALGFTILVVTAGMSASAQQTQRYWITLRDRGSHTTLSKLNAQDLGISEHALWRRAKVLPPDRLIDELDLPVDQSYLDQLRASGVTIRSTSRWFNAVSAELTPDQQATVASLPCVASVGPVAVFIRRDPQGTTTRADVTPSLQKGASSTDLNYGPSLTQLTNIKVVDVHNLGINGSGVVIGMLDDGFNNHTVHPALKNIKVIAEHDFVQGDSNTSVAPGEYSSQGFHGETTLSTIGGYDSGKLIGVAYGASFILAKTEVDSTETRVEEDYWVSGLEWEERLGAEIVTSSLGYNIFDDGTRYTFQNMDGRTATTSKAARIAARKGVLVVNAMGNEYHSQPGTLIVPADADSIISVGAVYSDGTIAGFSSVGPTSDGRTKPEVMAQGVNVYVASGTGNYGSSSGTSYATPLTAGVAALVLSAHPTWTPMQVRDRMTQTAKPLYDSSAGMKTHPNNYFGWGMVDALNAVGKFGPGSIPTEFALYHNYPNPFNGSTTILVDAPTDQEMDLSVFNLLGQKVCSLYKGRSTPGVNTFYWRDGLDDANNRVATGIYICRLSVAGTVFSQKIVYLK